MIIHFSCNELYLLTHNNTNLNTTNWIPRKCSLMNGNWISLLAVFCCSVLFFPLPYPKFSCSRHYYSLLRPCLVPVPETPRHRLLDLLVLSSEKSFSSTSQIVALHNYSFMCSNDQGEPAVSYRWTCWVWEVTGWSWRLEENDRSL